MRVQADIAGTVCRIEAAPGQAVQEGDTVLIVESMKMEIPISAPAAGTVRAVHVAEGDVVQEDTVVFEIAR
ncbi:MAG: biotin/lipoyl-binding carrier protein [Rhodoferax sp.]|jgi:biotin carboxyl carrier protein|nr:biotin/lipoyl-binding carrier protein [Rhodoferax sp.]